MKFTILDLFISCFCLILTFFCSAALVNLLSYGIQFSDKYLHLIKIVLFFVVFFLFLGGIYPRILRLFSPSKDAIFSSEESTLDCLFWKQTVFSYEWTASIVAYIIPVIFRVFLYRLLGAKIGKGVLIAGKIVEPQMVSLGNYSLCGEMSLLMAHAIMGDKVVLKKIIIGNHVSVGAHAIIMPGVTIGDNSIIATGSLVPMNTRIPANEVWRGIPAKRWKSVDASDVRS